MKGAGWREVAAGVLIRRYTELDLTVGLVLGDELAAVVDTRGDHRQGAELAAAVRDITSLPWHVVLTHGHFDHCFGTEAFLPAPVWAHQRCPVLLERPGQRERWIDHYRAEGAPETADALAATTIVLPDHLVTDRVDLDLGGRAIRLEHPGRGHTDHDLVITVPDAAVRFAGDLVEQGAPPDFEDAHPEQWPSTLDALLEPGAEIIIPGHGDPVNRDFVLAQRAELVTVAELRRDVRSGAITKTEALKRSPYPAATTLAAVNAAGGG